MSESPAASRLPGRRTIPAVVSSEPVGNPSPELIFADSGSANRNRGSLVPQRATEVPDGGVAAVPWIWA
jgi:hypothetical protein